MSKSYKDEIASQVPAAESRKLTTEEQKVRGQENERYTEGKRQQRMEELSKTVKPFKKGGKVAGKLATRGYGICKK